MTPIKIPYENLNKLNAPFKEAYKTAFENFLNTGYFILGDQLKQFESSFASYIGSPHCVGLASGLDALILGLKVLNLPKNGEVIVPANTYIASILSIIHEELIPILVDADPITQNIDPKKILEHTTSNTCAIMVVHMFGKSCDMDPIVKIAADLNIPIIEDCAQAHGAKYKGKTTGTFGKVAAFSFYPTKNLGALGDGGAITTTETELANRIRLLRNYGSEKRYYNEEVGLNSRLDELQAAFLNIKLKSLEKINHHKKQLAKRYFEGLSEKFQLPDLHPDYDDVFHIFNVRLENRDQFRAFLSEHGIGTDIHYPIPPHHQVCMQPFLKNQCFPVSEKIHETTVSLPISYFHSQQDIDQVIETANRFFK